MRESDRTVRLIGAALTVVGVLLLMGVSPEVTILVLGLCLVAGPAVTSRRREPES